MQRMALKLQKTGTQPWAWGLPGLLTKHYLQASTSRTKETAKCRCCFAIRASCSEQMLWEEDEESSPRLRSIVGMLTDRFSWYVCAHGCLETFPCPALGCSEDLPHLLVRKMKSGGKASHLAGINLLLEVFSYKERSSDEIRFSSFR